MKKISLVLMVLLLVFSGCSNNKKEVVYECTYTIDNDGYTYVDTYYGDEAADKVEKVVMASTINVPEDEQQKYIDQFENTKANVSKISGAKYSSSVKGDVIYEEIVIEIDKADFNELREINLINTDKEQIDYISIKSTLSGYQPDECLKK